MADLTADKVATLVKALATVTADLRATYAAIGKNTTGSEIVISIGQFGRLAAAEAFLKEVAAGVEADDDADRDRSENERHREPEYDLMRRSPYTQRERL